MVIRVAGKNVESAKRLVAGLVGLFDGEGVSLGSDAQVQVELNGRSGEQAMGQALSSVERWLEETGIGSTDVWVDDRKYRMSSDGV
jgi:hypothetical protein